MSLVVGGVVPPENVVGRVREQQEILASLPAESGPAPFRRIGPVPQRPAPQPGQDTVQICRDVLGFDDAHTERLLDQGVLFTTPERIRA